MKIINSFFDSFFFFFFFLNPSFKIVMLGLACGQAAVGRCPRFCHLVNLFFKVICYLYSSVDCFHIW